LLQQAGLSCGDKLDHFHNKRNTDSDYDWIRFRDKQQAQALVQSGTEEAAMSTSFLNAQPDGDDAQHDTVVGASVSTTRTAMRKRYAI